MPLKYDPKLRPLWYDASGLFMPGGSITRAHLAALASRLEAAREALLVQAESYTGDRADVPDAAPAYYVTLPERILASYKQDRRGSKLGRILAAAKHLRDAVDQVVVLISGGAYLAARALFECCCHPYHNHQTRGERGGRPRVYLAPYLLDNDELQGLLDLLPSTHESTGAESNWALVVVDDGANDSVAAAEAIFLNALARHYQDSAIISRHFALVTASHAQQPSGGQSFHPAAQFRMPPLAGAWSVFTVGILLPASLMGMDIVGLLEGAAAMTEQFRTAPAFSNHSELGENAVLDYAGTRHLLEQSRPTALSTVVPWGRGLEAAAHWLGALDPYGVRIAAPFVAESQLPAIGLATNPLSTCHLYLVSESVRRDRLAVPDFLNVDSTEATAGTTKLLTDRLAERRAAERQHAIELNQPTAELRLAGLDEASLGQFFQMMMLFTLMRAELASPTS